MRGGRLLTVPSEAHQAWHEEQMWFLKKYDKFKIPGTELKISMVMYAPDKRRGDLSNRFESVADLLVDAGIIEDDSWFIVPSVTMAFGGIDRENPRVEIDIMPLPDFK